MRKFFLNEKNGKVWHVHLIKAACDKNNRETECHGDQDSFSVYILCQGENSSMKKGKRWKIFVKKL